MQDSVDLTGKPRVFDPPGRYLALIATFTTVSLVIVAFIHVHGSYAFPRWFAIMKWLFHFQYALFGGALLAALLYFLHIRGLSPVYRRIVLALFYAGFVWVVIWIFVHRVFGIDLSISLIVDVLVNQAPISETGVSITELILAMVLSGLTIVGLTILTEKIASRYDQRLRRKCAIAFTGLFLLVHLPVRAYFVYYLNRNDYAALGYDDCVPFPLRPEQFLPGDHGHRLKLENLESADRTTSYLEHMRETAEATVPRPYNVLWINVESLRFDAIRQETMPELWKYRDEFQIRLNTQHWSNANATHFAVFSMLTGLSGYQLPALIRSGLTDPFLALLQSNGYRLRFGKKAHLESADLLGILPPGALAVDIDTSVDRGDERMIDSYLQDRRDGIGPRFDFLAIDMPHYPYFFAEQDAVFQPAPPLNNSEIFSRFRWPHVLLSKSELDLVRNRYWNACHSSDRQIGRALADLKTKGNFANTIVVVVGDHGEEFQERGQITHSSVLNDYQGRTVLWMHLPQRPLAPVTVNVPTMHIDIVPTILDSLGFSADILYTQGRSLLGNLEYRPMLCLSEQGGVAVPQYRCLVTPTYISRWLYGPTQYLFSGVQRRDGSPVNGRKWLREVRHDYRTTAEMYELLPDVSQPPNKFHSG